MVEKVIQGMEKKAPSGGLDQIIEEAKINSTQIGRGEVQTELINDPEIRKFLETKYEFFTNPSNYPDGKVNNKTLKQAITTYVSFVLDKSTSVETINIPVEVMKEGILYAFERVSISRVTANPGFLDSFTPLFENSLKNYLSSKGHEIKKDITSRYIAA